VAQDLFGSVPETPPPPQKSPAEDLQEIARAMALLWTWAPRSRCYELLRHQGARSRSGKAFTHAEVKDGLEALEHAGQLVEHPQRAGFWRLKDEVRGPLYRQLLDEVPLQK
jgi:hypothetical protein